MANPGKLLINVVRSNKPKALIGLNQKVRGQVQWDFPSPVVVTQAVDDVGQKVMRARKRGVEPESGRERLGRLFETARMHERDSQIMM